MAYESQIPILALLRKEFNNMEFLVENKLFRVDKTVVTIRKEQPFTYYTRELDGDHQGDSDEKIIQAVLEQVRAELDPTSAIVQAQAKLEETQAKIQENEQKLAETEAKQTATDQAVKHNQEETDRYGDYPCGRFKCCSRQDNRLWNQLQGIGRVDSTC